MHNDRALCFVEFRYPAILRKYFKVTLLKMTNIIVPVFVKNMVKESHETVVKPVKPVCNDHL